MPAPIIPAPSTPTLVGVNVGTSLGRSAPPLMAERSKKNAWIMFLLLDPVTSSAR